VPPANRCRQIRTVIERSQHVLLYAGVPKGETMRLSSAKTTYQGNEAGEMTIRENGAFFHRRPQLGIRPRWPGL